MLADKASALEDYWFAAMARLVVLSYGGESASAPGCLCDGTGTVIYGKTITPLQLFCSAKAPV